MAINVVEQKSSSSKTTIIFAVVSISVVIIGAIVWVLWLRNRESGTNFVVFEGPVSEVISRETSPPPELSDKAKEILHAVEILKNINLDTKFFEDPRFQSLRRTNIDIPRVEPTGVFQFRFTKTPRSSAANRR